MGLNTRQEAFCLEYAKCGNATEAYRKAGYNPKTEGSANASACQLLRNPKIQARLAELQTELSSERIASAAEIQAFLTSVLRGEAVEEQVVVEGCGDGVSEAKIVKRRPLLKDSIKAGETLAKMQGALDGSVKVNVVVPVIGGEGDLAD